VHASGPFSLFGRKHRLLLGADWSKVRDDQDTYYSEMDTPLSLTNVYEFDPGRIPPAVRERMTRSYPGYGATQKGFYGRANLSLTDQLTAIVGGRYASYSDAIHQLQRRWRSRAVASTTAKAVSSPLAQAWSTTRVSSEPARQ
jgi:outer membrane receptor for ferric coprogen and ferric-rhodotorulic acid